LLVGFVVARMQGLMIDNNAQTGDILGVPIPHLLNPFASAVSVLGGLGHFLALLIMSNMYSRLTSKTNLTSLLY
jgi:hypothetical protein